MSGPADPPGVSKEALSPAAQLAQVYKALVAEERRQWRPSLAGIVGVGFVALAVHLFRTRR